VWCGEDGEARVWQCIKGAGAARDSIRVLCISHLSPFEFDSAWWSNRCSCYPVSHAISESEFLYIKKNGKIKKIRYVILQAVKIYKNGEFIVVYKT